MIYNNDGDFVYQLPPIKGKYQFKNGESVGCGSYISLGDGGQEVLSIEGPGDYTVKCRVLGVPEITLPEISLTVRRHSEVGLIGRINLK